MVEPKSSKSKSKSKSKSSHDGFGGAASKKSPEAPPRPRRGRWTTAYIRTNFAILAHHAWHTLTLGLGTKNSKAAVFVFESAAMKAAAEAAWPGVVPLGDVGRRLIRAAPGNPEMARFKFRKGCVTFYVYTVRTAGARGFARADELRAVVEAVARLKDFLDHTAMLALPGQRSIDVAAAAAAQVGVVH
ncbi:uncharacterized protein [Miscanthus floridulus]|uniref:uncharacterized protein n=1 Tax=Miscanthus floridulus TaxID=154761 RepID=UPI0034577657